MSRKRRAVKHRKKARKKRLGMLLYRLLFSTVLIVASILAITIFFKVSSVEVAGETRYSNEEILQTVSVKEGDNLFLINKFDIANRLLDKYIYIDEIRIRRKLPDKLVVNITECQPSMTIQNSDGTYFILDKKGKILEQTQGENTYMKLFGIKTENLTIGQNVKDMKDEKIEKTFTLINILQEHQMLEKTSFINVEKSSEVQIGYDNRFVINFGFIEDMDYKIKYINNLIQEKLSPSDTGILDLTDMSNVRFRPMSTLKPYEKQGMINPDGTISK